MTEWWLDFTLMIHARDEDERDRIIERLKKALAETEYKVTYIDCTHAERA